MKKSARGFTAVEILIVVAIIGILIAIAVPGFQKARSQSRQRQCEENLTRIDMAKEQWALEKNKTAGTVVTTEELLAGDYLKKEYKCPTGGTYAINEVGKSPSCSLHGKIDSYKPPNVAPGPRPERVEQNLPKKVKVEFDLEQLLKQGSAPATIQLVE